MSTRPLDEICFQHAYRHPAAVCVCVCVLVCLRVCVYAAGAHDDAGVYRFLIHRTPRAALVTKARGTQCAARRNLRRNAITLCALSNVRRAHSLIGHAGGGGCLFVSVSARFGTPPPHIFRIAKIIAKCIESVYNFVQLVAAAAALENAKCIEERPRRQENRFFLSIYTRTLRKIHSNIHSHGRHKRAVRPAVDTDAVRARESNCCIIELANNRVSRALRGNGVVLAQLDTVCV